MRTSTLALITSLVLLALVALAGLSLSSCVTPSSRPMLAQAVPKSPETSETLRECRRMRDRSFATAAIGSGAAALSAGLGGLALPTDERALQLGLGVGSVVAAATSAALALLSSSYQSAVDRHCDPWP